MELVGKWKSLWKTFWKIGIIFPLNILYNLPVKTSGSRLFFERIFSITNQTLCYGSIQIFNFFSSQFHSCLCVNLRISSKLSYLLA